MTTINCINVPARVAILDDGRVCPLSVLLDRDGDETDDAHSAVVGVADLPDGMFEVVEFADFEVVATQ